MTQSSAAITAAAMPPSSAPTVAASSSVIFELETAPAGSGVRSLKQLPVGCEQFLPPQGSPVVICRAPSEAWYEKALPNAPSLLLSFVALIIALRANSYSRKKDTNARVQSIMDDYWLRKIVSPASIEPFIKASTDIIANLPEAGTVVTAADVQNFGQQHRKILIDLHPAFDILGVFDLKLKGKVDQSLDDFEDCLGNYIGALRLHIEQSGPAPSKADAITAMAGFRTALLKEIQNHQAKLIAG